MSRENGENRIKGLAGLDPEIQAEVVGAAKKIYSEDWEGFPRSLINIYSDHPIAMMVIVLSGRGLLPNDSRERIAVLVELIEMHENRKLQVE